MVHVAVPEEELVPQELVGEGHTLTVMGDDTPAAELAGVEFLVAPYMGAPVPPEVLAEMRQVKVIQLLSAGYEHWADAVPAGVALAGGTGIHGQSTAELAVAGVLSLIKQLPTYLDLQRQRRWERLSRASIAERHVVVLGAGDVGGQAAATLSLLGARSITVVGRRQREGVAGIDELDGLLPTADVLVLGLPLSDATYHLMDARRLALLPDGAILANVGRGGLVDTDALLAELQAERLQAFLDVTEPEPLPAEHPLWHAPGLVLTPHVGGGARGWMARARALITDQVRAFAEGQPLRNVIE